MKRPVILIIDDSPTSRAIVRRCMEAVGWEGASFLDAADGYEALDMLAHTQPDLITVDLTMPGLSGERFLEIRGRQQTKACPVVCISSGISESYRTVLYGLGVAALVDKPVTPERMHAALESLPADLRPQKPDAGLLEEVPHAFI